jgi:hypothetical protein
MMSNLFASKGFLLSLVVNLFLGSFVLGWLSSRVVPIAHSLRGGSVDSPLLHPAGSGAGSTVGPSSVQEELFGNSKTSQTLRLTMQREVGHIRELRAKFAGELANGNLSAPQILEKFSEINTAVGALTSAMQQTAAENIAAMSPSERQVFAKRLLMTTVQPLPTADVLQNNSIPAVTQSGGAAQLSGASAASEQQRTSIQSSSSEHAESQTNAISQQPYGTAKPFYGRSGQSPKSLQAGTAQQAPNNATVSSPQQSGNGAVSSGANGQQSNRPPEQGPNNANVIATPQPDGAPQQPSGNGGMSSGRNGQQPSDTPAPSPQQPPNNASAPPAQPDAAEPFPGESGQSAPQTPGPANGMMQGASDGTAAPAGPGSSTGPAAQSAPSVANGPVSNGNPSPVGVPGQSAPPSGMAPRGGGGRH